MAAKELDHKLTVNGYVVQLAVLAKERDEIERKMGKVHLAIRGLLNLIDDNAEREIYREILQMCSVRIGITDLILQCLTAADKPMTPREIRDYIVNYGSEVSTQQNLLQSVHTMLTRMKDKWITEEVNDDGDKAYRLLPLAERLERAGIEFPEINKRIREIEKLLAFTGVSVAMK